MADLERGKRIQTLRKAKAERLGRRVTQAHMAEAVGVSLRAAQEWEYGGGIEDAHLPKLIRFLDTDADELLRGETPDLMADLSESDPYAEQLDRIERMVKEILREIKKEDDDADDEGEGPLPAQPPGPLRPPSSPSEAEPGNQEEGHQRRDG